MCTLSCVKNLACNERTTAISRFLDTAALVTSCTVTSPNALKVFISLCSCRVLLSSDVTGLFTRGGKKIDLPCCLRFDGMQIHSIQAEEVVWMIQLLIFKGHRQTRKSILNDSAKPLNYATSQGF